MRTTILAMLAWLLCAAMPALAQRQASVELLETFPAGDTIEVQPGKNVYLRVAYRTDQPARIWVRPYYRGEQAQAGTHPSFEYSGEGELLAWFFLEPGARVDEIRVSAGNGNPERTPEIARWPLRVSAYSNAAAPAPEPDWVVRMREADKQRRDAAFKAQMSQPVPAGQVLLFTGFAWLMLGVGLLGLAWPAWALWKWQGRWRRWAMLPAAVVGFVLLRIVSGVIADPTSHNLWPFELLMAGGFSLVSMLVLALLRRRAGAPAG